ncbi:hypothetical protein KJ644_00760 [Candidatus Dependentiae bacterium]|nr:hypothetical protein [Candidatus Dependentiae bacterium]MBU4386983.1 hypothetical protein [Candidatus Dependentiae bacterium]MCG2756121.1 hypothetical protein [Candidatus Dependentiae bacterium]
MCFIRIKIAISLIFLICSNFYIYSNIEIKNSSGFDFLVFYQDCDNKESVNCIKVPFNTSNEIESNENNKFELEFSALEICKSKNLTLQFSKDSFYAFDGDVLEISFDYDRATFMLLLRSKDDINKDGVLYAQDSSDSEENLHKWFCVSNENFEITSIQNNSEDVALNIHILVGEYFRDFIVQPNEKLNLVGKIYIVKINDFDDVELWLKPGLYTIKYVEIENPKKLILKYKINFESKVIKQDIYAENHFRRLNHFIYSRANAD